MIIGVTGKIGSGKTYWAVHWLVRKYYEWDESILTWATKGSVRVVTNIRDFRLPHVSLVDEIERYGIGRVFSKTYVEGFKGTTAFIIDEAQFYFDRQFKDKDILLFLQTSRHYGVDIVLITQDLATLSLPVRVLCEYEIIATERSLRLKKVFTYQFQVNGQVFKRAGIKFDPQIAALYRSFEVEEGVPPTSGLTRYIGFAIGFVIVLGLVLVFGVGNLFSGSGTKQAKPVQTARAPVKAAPRPEQAASRVPDKVDVKNEVEKLNKELGEKNEAPVDEAPVGRIERVKDANGQWRFELYENDKYKGVVRVHR